MKKPLRHAFTITELLVVIAIIGGLIALLLPAVQSARESARQVTCRNNLKQLALGWHLHTSVHGIFPSGGWMGGDLAQRPFTGDPDRGFGKRQPGTWTFSVLPYIEQQALQDAGRGRGFRNAIDPDAFLLRYSTPVPIFACPTRRRQGTVPVYFEWKHLICPLNIAPADWDNFNLTRVAIIDYAANQGGILGQPGDLPTGDLPTSYEEADDPNFVWFSGFTVSGICDMRSSLRDADIEDGLSQTYMMGEGMLPPSHYDGVEPGRSAIPLGNLVHDPYVFEPFRMGPFALAAWGPDPHPPEPDNELTWLRQFGSAHPHSFHMAFCDGSVRRISYDIDPATHVHLGFRSDGVAVDMSKLE